MSADGAGVFTAAGTTLYRFDVGAGAFVTQTTNLPATILRLQPSPAFAADHILLAGTPDGVFVSNDGGTTFTPSAGFAAFRVTDIDGPPDSLAGGDLFLAGEYGVWKRAGGVWQPANNGMASRLAHIVNDLAVSPAYQEDGTLFAAANRYPRHRRSPLQVHRSRRKLAPGLQLGRRRPGRRFARFRHGPYGVYQCLQPRPAFHRRRRNLG